MKVILGSKTLAGWFEGETEADWEISSMIENLKASVVANALWQATLTIDDAKRMQEMNATTVYMLREMMKVKEEITQLMKGGAV